jgi:hypothetical protein
MNGKRLSIVWFGLDSSLIEYCCVANLVVLQNIYVVSRSPCFILCLDDFVDVPF